MRRVVVPWLVCVIVGIAASGPLRAASASMARVSLDTESDGLASPHAALERVVDGVRDRLRSELDTDALVGLTPERVLARLSDEERAMLASGFVRFRLDRNAVLHVAFHGEAGETPFWLPERGFERRPELDFLVDGDDAYDVWSRRVQAGEVALGIPSFSGELKPYIVFAAPVRGNSSVRLTPAIPGTDVIEARVGARPFLDDDDAFTTLPDELVGLPVLRTYDSWELVSRIVGHFRETPYPSSGQPDHLLLTWQDDPRDSVSIQWRTDESVEGGVLWIAEQAALFGEDASAGRRLPAAWVELETPEIVNDPVVRLHRVRVDGLEPDTRYLYAASADGGRTWTSVREFRTAAEAADEPWSFVYLGDAQNGLSHWGRLVREADFRFPEARFYIVAGDLVDKGRERDDWDVFFEEGSAVFDGAPIVPAIGNHDSHGGHPTLYLSQLALPANGTEQLDPGRTYHVRYRDLLVVVLDSNHELVDPQLQSEWLDRVLGESDARWKVVVYHHPFYASRPGRDNFPLRAAWGAIFDRHGVDLVLQGHDHAYMRTVPMRGHAPVSAGDRGTVYVVAVSGTKMYEQALPPFAALGMPDTRTFQVIDVDPATGTLTFRAIDIEGRVVDRFELRKPPPP